MSTDSEVERYWEDEQAPMVAASRVARQADWKRRQAIRTPDPVLLEPTLPERINRLNPSERHQVQSLIRSMKLRKIVKRTLVEAFWAAETSRLQRADSMLQLRQAARTRESLTSYERALTTFEPEYVHTSYGPGQDSLTVKRALEQSMQVLT
jgi:hypothetical protein